MAADETTHETTHRAPTLALGALCALSLGCSAGVSDPGPDARMTRELEQDTAGMVLSGGDDGQRGLLGEGSGEDDDEFEQPPGGGSGSGPDEPSPGREPGDAPLPEPEPDPSASPDTCPGQALSLTGWPLQLELPASLSGLSPRSWGSCGGDKGNDAVFSLVAPQTGTVRVRVDTPVLPPNFPPVVYVRHGDCAQGAELRCEGALTGLGAVDMEFTALQGEHYYLFVDQSRSPVDAPFTMIVEYE